MVNLDKLKLTILQQEILRVLFIESGHPLNQRNIAKILNVSQPAVMKSLPGLEKMEFARISKDKESKRWSIELNRDNPRAMQLKRSDNLKQVYESGLADFLENEFAGGTVILFGSYSMGEDTINSDIDIAVIGRKEKEINISEYEKSLGRKIFINFYSSLGGIHKDLRENILNGIILSGSVEL